MSPLPYERVLVPIADLEDARRTADAVATWTDGTSVVAAYVVEKVGGAPDPAGVEQREEYAERLFDAFESRLRDADVTVETRVAYGVDVADALLEAADEAGADAIVFVSRRGGRLRRLLSGDVTRKLVDRTDRPILVLPGEAT